jgi:hypothetical protein
LKCAAASNAGRESANINETLGRIFRQRRDDRHDRHSATRDCEFKMEWPMPLKKACVCGHGSAIHHPEKGRSGDKKRNPCNFPKCRCKDYKPAAQIGRLLCTGAILDDAAATIPRRS